jgi:hypothetical protein
MTLCLFRRYYVRAGVSMAAAPASQSGLHRLKCEARSKWHRGEWSNIRTEADRKRAAVASLRKLWLLGHLRAGCDARVR